MHTDELDFVLPPELIAQAPAGERSASRLLHYRRADGAIVDRGFADLASLLRAGDLLVFNDSKVIAARFTLAKETGGLVEGLFIGTEADGAWRVMLRNLGPLNKPLRFGDAPEIVATPTAALGEGQYRMLVDSPATALEVLARVGRMPLPPYIKRARHHDDRDAEDRRRYQTVYAREDGSVAAPTAGLHFTPALLEVLKARGVEQAFVTLHVGLGTFKPVTADTLEGHAMHAEEYTLEAPAVEAINRAKAQGRRVIAVGTTATRVLESQPAGPLSPGSGSTRIFIYPPYAWKHVGAMVTNFHLPRSTLIALVAALVGLDEQRRIYGHAIEQRYRFFSYGDAMFVE